MPSTIEAIPGLTLDWGATASWVGATVPVSGDTVVFRQGGVYKYTSGLDQSAVNLAAMVAVDCEITTVGQLKIAVNNSGRGLILALRSGSFRIAGATNIVSVERGGADISIESGAQAIIYASNGARVVVAATATCEDVRAVLSGVIQVMGHATDRIKAKIASGGVIETHRDVEEAYIGDGRLSMFNSAKVSDGSTGGVVHLLSDRSVLKINADRALTHANVVASAGLVDCSKSLGVQTFTANTETPASRWVEETIGGPIVRSSRTKIGFVGTTGGSIGTTPAD